MAGNVREFDIVFKVTGLDKVNAALAQVGKQSTISGKAITGAFVAGQLAVAGLNKAYQVTLNLATGVVRAANEQERALVKLNAATRAHGNDVAATNTAVTEFASKIQQTTKIADEQVISIAANIEAMTGLKDKGLVPATQAAIQLNKAYGVEFDAASKLVAKALNGNTTGLARYGVQLKGVKGEQEILNAIFEKTSAGMAIAEAELNTVEGAWAQLQNAIGEVKETIGNLIIQNPFLITALKGITAAVFDVNSGLQGFISTGDNATNIMKGIGRAAITAASGIETMVYHMTRAATYFDPSGADAFPGPVIGAFPFLAPMASIWKGSVSSDAVDKRTGLDIAHEDFQANMEAINLNIQHGTTGPNQMFAPSAGGGNNNAGGGGGKKKKGRPDFSGILGSLGGGWGGSTGMMGGLAGGGALAASMRRGRMDMPGFPSAGGGWDQYQFPFTGVDALMGAGGVMAGISGTAGMLSPWNALARNNASTRLSRFNQPFALANERADMLSPGETAAPTGWQGNLNKAFGQQGLGAVAGGLMSGGVTGALSVAGGMAGNAILPGIGGLIGGFLGKSLGKLFGSGKKQRGESPNFPQFVKDVQQSDLLTQLVNITKTQIAGSGLAKIRQLDAFRMEAARGNG